MPYGAYIPLFDECVDMTRRCLQPRPGILKRAIQDQRPLPRPRETWTVVVEIRQAWSCMQASLPAAPNSGFVSSCCGTGRFTSVPYSPPR